MSVCWSLCPGTWNSPGPVCPQAALAGGQLVTTRKRPRCSRAPVQAEGPPDPGQAGPHGSGEGEEVLAWGPRVIRTGGGSVHPRPVHSSRILHPGRAAQTRLSVALEWP